MDCIYEIGDVNGADNMDKGDGRRGTAEGRGTIRKI